MKGIEPSSRAWEAHVLPLNHTRGAKGISFNKKPLPMQSLTLPSYLTGRRTKFFRQNSGFRWSGGVGEECPCLRDAGQKEYHDAASGSRLLRSACHRCRPALVLMLALWLPGSAGAMQQVRVEGCVLRNRDLNDGLPSTRTNSVARTPDGFVWLVPPANSRGLTVAVSNIGVFACWITVLGDSSSIAQVRSGSIASSGQAHPSRATVTLGARGGTLPEPDWTRPDIRSPLRALRAARTPGRRTGWLPSRPAGHYCRTGCSRCSR